MKLINNKRYLVFVMLGFVNILIGLAEMLKIIPYSGMATPGVSMIGSGIFVLAIGLYLSRTPESKAMPDERTKKRDMKASSGALGIVLAYVTLLALMDVLWSSNIINLGEFFLIFNKPGDISVLFSRYMSIIFVAVVSVTALTVYLDKKGDIK